MPPQSTLSYFLASLTRLLITSSLLPVSSSSEQCSEASKKTLLGIKSAFGDPLSLSSWSNDTDCCTWAGVQCDIFTGQVDSLTFASANLSGHIPPSIADLPALSSLTFNNLSGLVGPIPPSLSTLTALKHLTITNTGVSGPVPPSLGDLTQLLNLDLSHNHLTGEIPESFGDIDFETVDLSANKLAGDASFLFGEAKRATYVNLSWNKLDFDVSEKNISSDLVALDLSHNHIHGRFSCSSACDKLSYLNLSWNKLDFNMSSVSLPKNVVVLDLSHNHIHGGLETLESCNASYVNLSWNKLDFDMSSLVLPSRIVSLDLSHNHITGSVSWFIVGLEKLEKFNVSYNYLCGEIPSGGVMRRFDESCYVHNRCLCGEPLPQCSKLEVF